MHYSTSYTSFANICLDRGKLEVYIKARCDIHGKVLESRLLLFAG